MSRHRVSIAVIVAIAFFSARPVSAQDKSKLVQCEKSMGTLAVVEPQNEIINALMRYKLSSPTSLIRMMAQQ